MARLVLALVLVAAPAVTPRAADVAPPPAALTLLAAPADDDAWLRLAGSSVVRIVVQVPDENAEAVGTGVVLSANGEILTNDHVITGGSGIRVTVLGAGTAYRASVVGTNRALDIAVLRLSGASGLTAARLAPTAPVRVGERVAAIGAPDADATVAAGTVSGLHRTVQTRRDSLSGQAERLTNLIEIAADVEQGDSGGPLLDAAGHVIGLTVAATVTHNTGDPGGSGFAIPIATALSAARHILAATG